MHTPDQPQRLVSTSRVKGFTLIELLVAVVIVGVLAAVALPSFVDSIRKSRRADAFTAIAAIQQAQERWRGNNAAYTSSLTALNTSSQSASAYYTLAVSDASASNYVVTANAVDGKSQAQDGSCKVLAVQVLGGNLKYGSGALAPIVWTAAEPDTGRCWAK